MTEVANPTGTNGPRPGRTTGRLRNALTNLKTKQNVYPGTLVLRAPNGQPLPKPKPRPESERTAVAPDLKASLAKLKAATSTYVPQPLTPAALSTTLAQPVAALAPSALGGPKGALPEGGNPQANMALGKALAARRYGWTGREWKALRTLWMRESGWNSGAVNDSSGAAGIPQALPSAHPDLVNQAWMNDPMAQILWGLRYIKGRYGSPLAALAHSDQHHWY